MDKLLIICGATATGKTDLAISLAKQFNGELINADSRQVYKKMDIGTGKDIPRSSTFIHHVIPAPTSPELQRGEKAGIQSFNEAFSIGFRLKDGIPIWLVDVVDPDYPFNVGEYVPLAQSVITYIHSKGKLPIIVGGTGLYIHSLLHPPETLVIPPDEKLRKELEALNKEQLISRLQELDPQKWETMNMSDRNNPRRLIRAIEVAYSFRHPDRSKGAEGSQSSQTLVGMRSLDFGRYSAVPPLARDDIEKNIFLIGLTAPVDLLNDQINERVEKRMKEGMLDEIQALLNQGYDWKSHSFASLGYKEWKQWFQLPQKDKTDGLKQQITQQWKLHEQQYAKRQMTWFKKEKNITWFDTSDALYKAKVEKSVKKWYTFMK